MNKLFAALLLCVSVVGGQGAFAYDLSGLYSNANEQGWGANVIQQDNTLFITMFVYGPTGAALWLVGPSVTLTTAPSSGGSGTYSGDLLLLAGPYFGNPTFNQGAVSNRRVGTVTFTAPPNPATPATISYTADAVTVTKQVLQQSWTAVAINGTYVGSLVRQTRSTCTSTPAPAAFIGFVRFANAATDNSRMDLSFAFLDTTRNTYATTCSVPGLSTVQRGHMIVSTAATAHSCNTLGSSIGTGGFAAALITKTDTRISGVLQFFNASGTCSDSYDVTASVAP